MSNDEQVDIVIIGAGIIGCAIYHALARNTQKSILLLEEADAASKTTGESGGFIRIFHEDLALASLAAKGFDYYMNFKQYTGFDCGFTQKGFLYSSPQSVDHHLVDQINLLTEPCFHSAIIKNALNINDHLAFYNNKSCVYQASAGCINTRLACQNWIRSAGQNNNATVQMNTAVTNIMLNNGKVIGVETAQGKIYANNVVIAAGSATAKLIKTISSSAKKLMMKAFQYNYYQCDLVDFPALVDINNDLYVIPQKDYVIAGLLSQDVLISDANKWVTVSTKETSLKLHQCLQELLPEVAWSACFVKSQVSFDAFTEDNIGITGKVPEAEGLYVAAGYSSGGIKLAPAVADIICDQLIP